MVWVRLSAVGFILLLFVCDVCNSKCKCFHFARSTDSDRDSEIEMEEEPELFEIEGEEAQNDEERKRGCCPKRAHFRVAFGGPQDLPRRSGQQCCPICMVDLANNDGKQIVGVNCPKKHIFHMKCIEDWIDANSYVCPVCRTEI